MSEIIGYGDDDEIGDKKRCFNCKLAFLILLWEVELLVLLAPNLGSNL